MANAAAELLQLFEGWRDARGSSNAARRDLQLDVVSPGLRDHVRAMALLQLIEREIDELEHVGRRTGAFRRHFPGWVQAVLAMRTSSWTANTSARSDFSQPSMDALEQLADVLDHREPALHPDAVTGLASLLEEVLAAAAEDESLDERLHLHIRKTIRHLQTCVEEYSVYGESAAMDALNAVWAAMGAAAHRSKDPTRWERYQARFFFPTAAGLIANTPSLMLQIAQSGG